MAVERITKEDINNMKGLEAYEQMKKKYEYLFDSINDILRQVKNQSTDGGNSVDN